MLQVPGHVLAELHMVVEKAEHVALQRRLLVLQRPHSCPQRHNLRLIKKYRRYLSARLIKSSPSSNRSGFIDGFRSRISLMSIARERKRCNRSWLQEDWNVGWGSLLCREADLSEQH